MDAESAGRYPYPADQREWARREDPQADRDSPHVLRGGAFNDSHRYVRCAYRSRYYLSARYNFIGFRVVVRPAL